MSPRYSVSVARDEQIIGSPNHVSAGHDLSGMTTRVAAPAENLIRAGRRVGDFEQAVGAGGPRRDRPHQVRSLRLPLHDLGELIDMDARIRRRRTVTELISEYRRAA
jgi:hypothetical protein